MDRRIVRWIGLAVVGLGALLAFAYLAARQSVAVIDYSEFLRLLEDHKIASVTVSDTAITGRFTEPIDGRPGFVTDRVEPGLADELQSQGVDFSGAQPVGWFTSLLSWVLPAAVFFTAWYFLMRRSQDRPGMSGLLNIGKSRAQIYVEQDTGVSFDDVAGIDEAEEELQVVISFLRERDRYSRLGARIPRGILLVGPPGTGKTLLARAIAGEAGVPFFSISGSEFVEMFVGVGAARVRDLFDQARKAAPCIIFIDELDALGRARGLYAGLGGHDEKEQTLNQLLSELDGFDPMVGIVLIAATNRPEILDPALLRSGRFDRQIVVERPDLMGRAQILAVHVRDVTLDHEVKLDEIAGLTTGFTGADLANLVNEAAIIATRRDGDSVTADDFTAAVERIVAGTERRTMVMNPEERRRVAVHEMGHALVAAALPAADPVQKVSIIPRSIGALGYTLQRPTEDRYLIAEDELRQRMAVLMAGRAAELMVFGEGSTGAADDLAKVTDVARECVTCYGMSETLGPVALESQPMSWIGEVDGLGADASDFSEETAREIDLAVRKLVKEAEGRARGILEERLAELDAGAALLLEKETLTPDAFAPIRRDVAPVELEACAT